MYFLFVTLPCIQQNLNKKNIAYHFKATMVTK